MAGHSKFKNIQHRKGAQDKKKAKLFASLVREISLSAKSGADIQYNPRLRAAISAAKFNNLPKDRIEKAIAQANNKDNYENYFEITYEGIIFDGIAIIVEALTDNTNRTAANVRAIFSKYGGNLVGTGNASFLFDRLGIIKFESKVSTSEKLFDAAIEIGAEDIELDEEYHVVYTPIKLFTNIIEELAQLFGYPVESYIGWRPRNTVLISDTEKAQKLIKLVNALDDDDDVQRFFCNYEFSEQIYNNLLT
ncbi:transcriptional regulator [Orientia tsutsugamushi]|uniref:YebC/PmpR family DNA-binding transcriptional regulator n=1 Tax=Orientia tsutsugamushi TaxID=784 RepID=UPI0005F9900A|nr:YebC/PmpR family DNA-binding transcriptional regulator [Orientia tsutsugamushi]KJV74792.1 DNA-binding regulatory, YebC/PmpR family protein [Orientia tsutsugamushi str. TA763]SPP26264.1 transcriptional regulator [Orientia tsutsugamushi]